MIPLPISASDLRDAIISPAMRMLPAMMDTAEARVMLHAIALQESGLAARSQANDGPAYGLWQFERGGGVVGVLTHPQSRDLAAWVCRRRNVSPNAQEVWATLATSDVLACCFARLLLWTDPAPLPIIRDVDGAWRLYARTWRPGKPRPVAWPAFYAQAVQAEMGP